MGYPTRLFPPLGRKHIHRRDGRQNAGAIVLFVLLAISRGLTWCKSGCPRPRGIPTILRDARHGANLRSVGRLVGLRDRNLAGVPTISEVNATGKMHTKHQEYLKKVQTGTGWNSRRNIPKLYI
jgi:hypothetical protein